ncbi:MAG: pectate lyase [Gammaproteobacteria bacterium]|nr:MAG: pectate lyase [Gammaproteobacteria bacterium]
MLKKIMISALLIGVSATAMAANRPSGYTTICKIGETCSVSKSTNVAFGADGRFVYKILNGTFSCSVATFGSDPASDKTVKECSIPTSGSGTTSSTASSTASSVKSSSSSSTGGTTGGSGECVAGATIENKTVDCGGKTIGLSCPVGDAEGQPAVLTLKNATIKNVRLGKNGGADGIHCVSGNCRLENVVWEDICEDAASLIDSGKKLTVSGGSAYNSDSSSSPGGKPDKIFQHNSLNSTFEILDGFSASGVNGKLWRSCGNCSNNGGPRYLVVNNVTINGKVGSIAGVNRNYGDKATIRNLKIQGYKSGSPKVCEEFKGIDKKVTSGDSPKYGEYWNTAYCDVSKSDVTGF